MCGTVTAPESMRSSTGQCKGSDQGRSFLLHDGDGYDPLGDRMQTALALPKIIDALKQRGYTFATLPA